MLNVFVKFARILKQVKHAKCLGPNDPLEGQKFKALNTCQVLGVSKTHLTFPLLRDPKFTKQGKC